jgi:hypothetical protein
MDMTTIKWNNVHDGLPSKIDYGPYPRVLVALRCFMESINETVCLITNAELRYFGGDTNRPFWVDLQNCDPIENSAWHVTHWAPPIEPPK